jgi:hypothetical protein
VRDAARVAGDREIGADAPAARQLASSVPEEIGNNDPVTGRQARDDGRPQEGRGREAVQEQDWLSGAPRTGGIVIQAAVTEVDELTAHGRLPGHG